MTQDTDRDLSQLYRVGADETPPPRLDRLIGQAARMELRASPLRTRFETLLRWRMAIGAFAVVTLAVSLVTVMKEEAPSVLDPVVAPPPRSKPSVSDHYGQPVSPEREAGVTDRSQPPVSGQKSEERIARRIAPEPIEPGMAASKERDVSDLPKVAEARAPAAPTVEPPPAAATAPAAAAPSAMPRHDETRQRSNAGEAAVLGRTARREALPAPTAPVPDLHESPEVWVKRLQEWLTLGREQEVRNELERFRLRYPDFVLPESLRRVMVEAASAKEPTRAKDPAAMRSVP